MAFNDGRDEVDNGVLEVLPLNQMATQTKWGFPFVIYFCPIIVHKTCFPLMGPESGNWAESFFVKTVLLSLPWFMTSDSSRSAGSGSCCPSLSLRCFPLDSCITSAVLLWMAMLTHLSAAVRVLCHKLWPWHVFRLPPEKCLLTHMSRNCSKPQEFISVLSQDGRSLHTQWDVTIARPGNSLWEEQNAYQLSAVLRCPDSGQLQRGDGLHTSFLLRPRWLLLNSRTVASRTEPIFILLVPVHYSEYWEQTTEDLWLVCVGLKDS